MFYKLIFIFTVFLSSNLMANILQDIKTFDATFTQTIINPSNKRIVYNGHIFIKEPAKILWQYKKPIIKNVYVINNFAIVDEPELEQAIFTDLKNEINVLKLIQNAEKIDENKYLSKFYEIDYKLTLKNKKIHTIEYKDELENSVSIEFSDIKQNILIDDNIFKFIAPDYYDIIRK